MGLFILTNLNNVDNLLIKQKNISCIVKIKLYLCTTNLINIMNTTSEKIERDNLKEAYLNAFNRNHPEAIASIFNNLPLSLLNNVIKGLTRPLEITQLETNIRDFIKDSTTLELDGETIQTLVERLDMQEQLHKQYVASVFPLETTLDLIVENEEVHGKKCIKHRLDIILTDLDRFEEFIDEERLMERLSKPTKYSDSALTLLNNIRIACNLKNPESLGWFNSRLE